MTANIKSLFRAIPPNDFPVEQRGTRVRSPGRDDSGTGKEKLWPSWTKNVLDGFVCKANGRRSRLLKSLAANERSEDTSAPKTVSRWQMSPTEQSE